MNSEEQEKSRVDTVKNEELFCFIPRETTDKNRIAEILSRIYIPDTTANLPGNRLVDEDNKIFTPLGREVANLLAVKATEFPFLRIFHCYKRKSEERRFEETIFKLDDPDFYPSATADVSRNRYKDVWDDESFLALYENKNGEIASTCKIVNCPKCKGKGKEYQGYKTEEKIWMTCPNCNGSGKEGIYVCKRCDGKGRERGTRTTNHKVEVNCSKCGGSGKAKSVLKAYLSKDDKEIKWSQILEHEPKLHPERDLHFDWAFLRNDSSKKAAKISRIKSMRPKSGIVDPNANDLSDLPLANKEDLKRIYDVCYQKHDNMHGPNSTYASAFYKQNDKSDPNVRTECAEEEISIVTGVGWVRIDLQTGRSFWVNVLSKDMNQEVFRQYGKMHTALYSMEFGSRYRIQDYSVEVQNAIKQSKKNPVFRKSSSKKETVGKSRQAPRKRWKFVVLGLLLGFIGAHFAYAKRWFLFLLLWAGLITGGVMSGGDQSSAGEVTDAVAVQTENAEKKKSSSPIGGIGFAVWALLWIGGALFVKKDGKGNRM